MSMRNGNRNIILAEMDDGAWYSYEQIGQMTGLNKPQVNSTMQYLHKGELVESIAGPHKDSPRLYRKIQKSEFGASSRLSLFNRYWVGSHA